MVVSRQTVGIAVAGLVVAATVAVAIVVWWPDDSSQAEIPELSGDLAVEVLETYPHDPAAFTQGLELHDGVLYEGTGRYGESQMRRVETETGEVISQVSLADSVFGEGITIVDDEIWQLTWKAGFAIRRDRETLTEREHVLYDGEGWGLCYDQGGDRLVMSDGSAQLTFRDPETFDPTGTVDVTMDGAPLPRINELECVDGQVWANVWQTDQIVRIDPATGEVVAVVDASGLLTEEEAATADVLNGIAAVPDSDTFLITGKLWPTAFLVRFVPA
jgi:glutamine cyclotransferase